MNNVLMLALVLLLTAPPMRDPEVEALVLHLKDASTLEERKGALDGLVNLAYLMSTGGRPASHMSINEVLDIVSKHLVEVPPESQADILTGLQLVYDDAGRRMLAKALCHPAVVVRRSAARTLLQEARTFSRALDMPEVFVSDPVFRSSHDRDDQVRRDGSCILRLALHSMEDSADRPRPGQLRDRLRREIAGLDVKSCFDTDSTDAGQASYGAAPGLVTPTATAQTARPIK